MAKILLQNNNPRNTNWGTRAMVPAINQMLSDHILDMAPHWLERPWLDREFRCLRLPFGWTRLYDQRRVNPQIMGVLNRLSTPTSFFPKIADEFEYMADQWMAGRGGPFATEFIAAVKDSDVVVHNGEGLFLENKVPGCRALFLLWFAKTVLGKPTCEINQTSVAATMTHPVMPGMIKLVYPILDVVTVREPRSFDDLLNLGIKNVQLVPDVVFYLDTTNPEEAAFREWKAQVGLDHQPYFCFCGGALPMQRVRPDWDSSVVQLIKRLKQLVPQAVIIGTAALDFRLEEIAKATDSVYFGPDHPMKEMWSLLRGALFQLNGHYHQIMAGAKVGCPFIPLLTDTHKMQSLCEQLGYRITSPYDPTAFRHSIEDICEDAKVILGERDVLSNKLLARCEELKVESAKNAVLIKSLLG